MYSTINMIKPKSYSHGYGPVISSYLAVFVEVGLCEVAVERGWFVGSISAEDNSIWEGCVEVNFIKL